MALIGLVGSIASAGMSYMQQQSANNMQQQANDEWVAYQKKQSSDEWQRQEEMRQKAENAREGAVNDMTSQKQTQAQGDEAKRVTDAITPDQLKQDTPTLVGDRMLSGMQGGSQEFKDMFGDKITSAAQDARARIAALATMQSYGTSEFGLQNRSNQIFGDASNQINLQGNERQGSLGAYGAAKAVPPARVVTGSSAMGGIASSLAGIAGKSFGSSMAGGVGGASM
jgi:hypothetical protein